MSSFNERKRCPDYGNDSSRKSKQKFDKKAAKKEADKLVSMGIEKQESGRYDEARKCYERALSILDSYSEALYNLASLNMEILESDTASCHFSTSSQLVYQAADYLANVIASDTSKRGETTGMAHLLLANIQSDYKRVLCARTPKCELNYQDIVEGNYRAAIGILQSSKDLDTYILEYAQYLHSALNDIIETTAVSADKLLKVVSLSQRTLDVLTSALQTAFSSDIDSEVLALRGEVLSDAWNYSLKLITQNCQMTVVCPVRDYLSNVPHGTAVFLGLQNLSDTTLKCCTSMEALLSSQDQSSPESMHSIIDLTLSLIGWYRLNGNSSDFVNRCRYYSEVQRSLFTTVSRKRDQYIVSMREQGTLSSEAQIKYSDYILDVTSTFGDSLAALSTEMQYVQMCGANINTQLLAELVNIGLSSNLVECFNVVDCLNTDYGSSCDNDSVLSRCGASSGESILDPICLLKASRICYCLALTVFSTLGNYMCNNNVNEAASGIVAIIESLCRQGVLSCGQKDYQALITFCTQLGSIELLSSTNKSSTTCTTQQQQDDDNDTDRINEVRDLLYNLLCVEWRLRYEQGCLLCLVQYCIADRIVRLRPSSSREATISSSSSSSVTAEQQASDLPSRTIVQELLHDSDLAGLENAAWFPVICLAFSL